jgi:cytochrome c-type biogenesis protein CcmH
MAGAGRRSGIGPWIPWIAMAVVVVVALAIGTLGQGEPSEAERAQSLAESIRCPTCESQAVASSETPSAKAVRALIADRIEQGDTDEEILDFVDSRYPGQGLILEPSSSGFTGLVWALPVALVIVALAGLAYRFRDYRPGGVAVTDADRQIVEDALAGGAAGRSSRAGEEGGS